MLLGGVVCATLDAAPTVLLDEEGFRMPLPTGACMLMPQGRSDPLASFGGKLFGAAALPTREGTTVLLLVMSAPPAEGAALSMEMLRVAVDGTLDGLHQTSGGKVRAQPFEPIEAAGTVGIRWFLTLYDEWPARGAFVRLFGARRTYTLALFAPGDDARFRERVVELTGRVQLAPLEPARRGGFNRGGKSVVRETSAAP